MRIGDPLQQCTARYGKPKQANHGYYVFQDSDWTIALTFYRGRADKLTYTKAIGKDADFTTHDLISSFTTTWRNDDLRPLLKLNGGQRVWEEQEEGGLTHYLRLTGDGKKIELELPDIKLWTQDGLLHASFKVSAFREALEKRLTVSTRGYEERQDQATNDKIKMNRDDARRAWALGLILGSAPAVFLKNADLKEANSRLNAARREFRSLRAAEAARVADTSLDLPGLPAKTGDSEADFRAIMNFVGQGNDSVLKALGKDEVAADEPAVAGCFDLGLSANIIFFVLHGGTPEAKATFVEHLAAAGRNSNLPKELWAPFVEKARAGVAIEALSAAFDQMAKGVTKFLDAKQAEWKAKPKPEEA